MNFNKKNNKQEPKPSFRNTKSKFYNKKQSEFDQSYQKKNVQQNTGNYWKEKGNTQFKQGNLKKAIQNYTKAIQINSSESIFFSNRAKCFKILGNLELALRDAQQACELDSNNIKAHYICGCILAQMGKTNFSKIQKAENRLKKALRLCTTLKKTQFEDQISIKIFRLKKLSWLIQRQFQFEHLKLEKKIIQSFQQINQERLKCIRNIDKKIQQIKKKSGIPDFLCCKITLELMEDPVTTEQGHTYERKALQAHIKALGKTDPISRKQLKGDIYSNVALKSAVQHFLQQNPWAFEQNQEESYLLIQF